METRTKILILILGMIFPYTNAYCQMYDWSEKGIKKFFSKTSFIFEGEVIKSEGYRGDGNIFTSNIVRIDKIFKGSDSIKSGTIEVITEGGNFGNQVEVISDAGVPTGALGAGGKGIFFCNKSKI